jgi:hypothetical protein
MQTAHYKKEGQASYKQQHNPVGSFASMLHSHLFTSFNEDSPPSLHAIRRDEFFLWMISKR